MKKLLVLALISTSMFAKEAKKEIIPHQDDVVSVAVGALAGYGTNYLLEGKVDPKAQVALSASVAGGTTLAVRNYLKKDKK